MSTSNSYAYGVYLDSSSYNILTLNNFYTNQSYAVYVSGSFNHYNNSIDQSNKEYGKPILYYFNKNNLIIENNYTIGEIFIAYSNYTKINNVSLDKDGIVFTYVMYSNITNSKINTTYYGIYLLSSSNYNTISGNNVSTSGVSAYGVFLSSSSNNTISGNNVSTSGVSAYGVFLGSSSNNTISGNNVSTSGDSADGVFLSSSSNNTISGNNVSTSGSSADGVFLGSSSNYNTISGNNVSTSGSSAYGVYLGSSSNNTISGNNVSTSNSYAYGVYLGSSSNNTISGNNVSTSNSYAYGVYLSSSSYNILTLNNFYTNQSYAVYVSGSFNHYNNSIDQSNKEYGKPILYYFNKNNLIIENNYTIGEIFIAYSNYTKINNVSLDKDGIVFTYVMYSNITNSKINTTYYGIYLLSSSNYNTISGNNVSTSGG